MADLNYRSLQPELLKVMWLGEPEWTYTVAELLKEFEFLGVSYDTVRRALWHLKVQGLVAVTEGGRRNLRAEEQARLDNMTDEVLLRRRCSLFLGEDTRYETVADQWSLTEAGARKAKESG